MIRKFKMWSVGTQVISMVVGSLGSEPMNLKKITTTYTGNQNETYCGESSPYFDVLAFGCTCM